MIIKIVKVFLCESLDFFSDVWYNMIEVKIGLAARFFGQLGEGSGTLWAWVFTKRKFCPRQSVGADISREPARMGLALFGRVKKTCF